MFVSDFLGDANFGVGLIVYNACLLSDYYDTKIYCFTNTHRDRSNWFDLCKSPFLNCFVQERTKYNIPYFCIELRIIMVVSNYV